MKNDRTILLWIAGGAGLAALLLAQRKTIMLFGRKAVDAAGEAIFTLMLPDRAKTYSPIILRVSREEGVDPYLIFGLGDRETLWGTSTALDQQGPGGRGDGGHGYGLMQIDDRDADNAAFIASGRWMLPYDNVQFGVRKLKRKMSFFTSRSTIKGLAEGGRVYLTSSAASARGVSAGWYPDPRPLDASRIWDAAISAYNTGEGNVLRSLAAGVPAQTTTAGGDYVSDVVSRANDLAAKYDNATV